MKAMPCLAVWLASSIAMAADVTFTAKPTTKQDGAKVKISFAVSQPTDVEVAVLDKDGKVVRHLAAGALGAANPPPAPLQPTLAQSIEWDGKDDAGAPAKPAEAGFKVRVRLGLKPELDGFIAEDKDWIYQLAGLAADAEGNLYVYSSTVGVHRGSSRCMQVFDRAGKYVRTIMPVPADTPKAATLGFNTTVENRQKVVLDVPGDAVCPRNYFGTWPELYPGSVGRLVPWVTADGNLTISDSNGSIAQITSRGGCVFDGFWRRIVQGQPWGWRDTRGAQQLVPSPDGRSLYLCGFGGWDGKKNALNPDWPLGRVYRMDVAAGKSMEKWADLPDGDKPARCGPAALDPDGNLLVWNGGNQKVMVLGPDAKKAGEFDAACEIGGKPAEPDGLFVHRKTQEIYATCSRPGATQYQSLRKLVKFAPWKKGAAKVCEFDLPVSHRAYGLEGGIAHAALDDSADPAIVWAGSVAGVTANAYLLRLEDRGKTFTRTLDLLDGSRGRLAVKTRMAVHPDTDLVIYNDGYNRIGGVNGLTGEEVKLPFAFGVDMNVGLDGNWYVQTGSGYSGPICRYDREMKPIPVPGKPSNALGDVYGRMGAGYCTIGVAADRRGRVFSLQMYTWAAYAVAIFGPDGKPEDPGRMKDDPEMKKCPRFTSAVIGPLGLTPGGIQVDAQGNLYIGLKVLPSDHKPPAGFENARTGYSAMAGSIVKFGPNGGAAYGLKGAPPADKRGVVVDQRWGFMSPVNYKAFVEDPIRIYPGLSCMSGGFGDGCMCRQPIFQVDGWSRLWIPNATLNCVRVVDNNGNLIREFGRYGNIDSRGPGKDSLVKVPDIPLGWPQAVGVSRTNVYVSDPLNRRIVRLKKAYAAEEMCEAE